MAKFQRGSTHLALVIGEDGAWSGMITFEDVLEELVGKIGDEFDVHRVGEFVSLSDSLTEGRVVFGVEGRSLPEAIRWMIERVDAAALPVNRELILNGVLRREAAMSTYLGRGLAIPHCRLAGLKEPVLFFGRSDEGIPLETTNERVGLIFILLTPDHLARQQPRLLADIIGMIESEYVLERFQKAGKPEDIVGAVRDGQQVSLD